jgi:redox-sensitive bicupin YhaK (pirin superfamily)
MRAIKKIHGNKPHHWVGDGFRVKTLISHLAADPDFNYTHTDPFLLLDYAEPTEFAPNPNYNTAPYGIGQHPHKGFETVTIAYSGAVNHIDSAGGSGTILEGDVQWMTAGRGVMHEEFHSPAFGQRGGVFSMVQLWVNLPQAHKLTDPNYQTIKRADMTVVDLYHQPNDNISTKIGHATLIAGTCQDKTGLATTFTAVNLWDIELSATGTTTLAIPNSHTVMILVQVGEVLVNDTVVNAGELVQFAAPIPTDTANSPTENTATDSITLTYSAILGDPQTLAPVRLLLMSGEPIGEPIAGYGPFVMTTQEELKQTFHDYKNGDFI